MRNIDISNAGLAFWIFAVVGIIIILLQGIPAMILLWSLLYTHLKDKNKKGEVDEISAASGKREQETIK